MKTGHPNGSRAAVTLVEVVTAVAVLGVLAMGILGAARYAFFTLTLLRENQRATQIMLEKCETIRLYSWSQVNSNGFVPATFTDIYDPQAPTNSRGLTYYGTLTITNFPFVASYGTNLRELVVTLQWTNGTDLRHDRKVATYIARDGIQNYIY